MGDDPDPDPARRAPRRFEIGPEIGRGGMGQVREGRDVVLGRPVAIKTLPEHLANDAGAVARLQREARVLAKLNHPNIATIYSLEMTAGGTRQLILERVEGATLSARIRSGPIPIAEALSICRQIASAIEAAHERGVIHRDLKPSNIMVTAKGRVKVLDFGLARITEWTEDESRETELEITLPGQIIGTAGYISPEVLRGLPAGRSGDMFAFGCVLYECLAGSRAFAGSEPERIAATLIRDPDWSLLPADTPQPIRELLGHCLEKSRERRLRDMSDARAAIEAVLGMGDADEEYARVFLGASSNLPEPLTSFVGRERELAKAAPFLESGRLLTFTGAGGSGKTRLAVQLGQNLLPSFADGVWFVNLGSIEEAERVPNALASALGLRERAGESVLDTLEKYLAEREALMILDNCEHLLSACQGLVQTLLARCRKVRILATSREPLRVQGEQVFPVAPLATRGGRRATRWLSVEGGEGLSDAAKLFLDRALAVMPNFDRSARNLQLVEDVCTRLEGLPLAVELAAARVRVLSMQEVRTRLDDQLRLLTGAGPSAPARHQTLAATIGWSYELLTLEERQLFRSLAVFTGGWTLETARQVSAFPGDAFDMLDRLSRLVDKSLVVAETGEGDRIRFRFLETVRQFAASLLDRAGEGDRLRGRHLDTFVALAEEASPALYGPEQAIWFNRLEAEHENLLSAIAWSRRTAGDDPKALRIAGPLWRFWFGRGHFELGRGLLTSVLALPGAAAPTRDRVDALQGAGALAFHQNDFHAGVAVYRESYEIACSLGDEARMAFALGGLGNLHMGAGDYATARAKYEEALALFRKTRHTRGIGLFLSNLGRLTELEGDFETAYELFEESMQIFRQIGDVGSLALRLSSQGELSMRLGRRDRAREQLLECVRLMQELGEAHVAAYALERSAMWLEGVGEPDAAARLCGSADALRRRIAAPRSPKEKQELDAFLLRLQSALGGTRFGELWSQGLHVSFEKGLDEVLRRLEAAQPAESEA